MNIRKLPKASTGKKNYMSDEAFAALRKALKDALAFERGKCRGLRVTLIKGSGR
jgi:hypothetical protein